MRFIDKKTSAPEGIAAVKRRFWRLRNSKVSFLANLPDNFGKIFYLCRMKHHFSKT
ncbi:MAG: hypothetical protein LBR64_09085 [Dysgonamonadaceae bacterium]|nr:hypothetical protein [Dysgonamonadaceae bacterium]